MTKAVLHSVWLIEDADGVVSAACPDEKTAKMVRDRLAKAVRERLGHTPRYLPPLEVPFVATPEDVCVQQVFYVAIDEQGEPEERWAYTEVTSRGWPDRAWKGLDPTQVIGCSTRGYDAALKAARDYLARIKAQQAD